MRHFLLALLLSVFGMGVSAQVFWTEDFETDGAGVRYTLDAIDDEFNDGSSDHYGRTDGTGISGGYTAPNMSFFWAGEDIDDNGGNLTNPKAVTFASQTITGMSQVRISGLFGQGSAGGGGIDQADYMRVDYRVDGGTWTPAIWFSGTSGSNVGAFLDEDFNASGDGITALTNTLTPYSKDIIVSGDALEIKVTLSLGSGNEELAYDFLQFDDISGAATCSAGVTPGTATCDSVTAATDTYTATFSFVNGIETEALSVSVDNGNADVATISADGTITVTGAAEGVDVNLTLTNTGCSLMSTVTASTCVPIPDLVITEIVYNTAGTDDEWIEICNNEGADVDISGYEVLDASSVRFTFPASTTLTAGACITVSLGSNGDGTYNLDCPFTPDYGVDAVTNSTNVLSNSAETITLRVGGGAVVDVVSYDDADGADDNGNSLHVTDINADNSVTNSNWQEVTLGGSPGNNSLISNCAPTNTFVSFNESVINTSEDDASFTVCLNITNNVNVDGPDTEVFLDLGLGSTAVSPQDYDEDGMGTPFSYFGFSKDFVVFGAGDDADKCFTLFINDDALDEGQESIEMKIEPSNVGGGNAAEPGAISTLTINIADNDAPVVLPCTDLFISEYIEGGSNNKCIEIYNPSAAEVDMASEGYALYRYGNGASTPSDTLMLQGTLCPGAVYVVCNGSSAASFLAQADTTHSTTFFNGDDAMQLVKGAVYESAFGTSVDVIGQIGLDPGAAWTGTGCSTANNTLVRKSTIQMGDPDGSDAFDPSVEWDCFAQDTDTELGGHTSDCFTPAACSLTIADGGNQSACDPGTNTYSNDVLLTYSGDPGCGVIIVNGQEFAIGTSPQTITLTGLTADGLPVDVSAEFSADGTCSANFLGAFIAPDNCLPVNMIVINEVDYDQPESGDPAEFIELYNTGASAVDLDAYEVRLINGSGGSVYGTFDLPSVMLAAGDYYVLGSATVPNVDQIVFSGNNFQNGAPDGVELVFTGTQVDALSYEGDIAGIVETAGAPSDPGGSSATGLSRITDGTDTDDNSADFVVTCITPGEANVICAVNDDCADALNLSSSVWGEPGWTMHELGQQESLPGCNGDADDDIWFTFQASSANDVIIARDPSGTYNAVIEVFETCGGASLGCFDNYPAGQIERALLGGLIAGNTYRFRVYDSAAGASASTNVEVAVKTYQDGGLESAYCNAIDYDLSQSLYAERDALGELYSNPAVPVKGYSFRFQEQGGGLDVVYTHPNFTPYVSLGNVGGLEYGKTYDVSVSHKVKLSANGSIMEYWSDFGTSCPITLVATPPSTQVQDIYCSSLSDFFLADIIKADQVPGATQYRFTFVGGGDTFVETTTSYGVFLYNVGSAGNGLLYSTVYSVSVEVNVNGIWSAPGAACSIALSTQPESTAVQGTYCGGTYAYPQNPNYLLAESVLGADYYEWRFTPVVGGVAQTDVTSGVSLAMHLTSLDLSDGGDWAVEVRASAGGVLGDYGSSCPVTISANGLIAPGNGDDSEIKALQNEDLTMTIFPNPNDGSQFRLNVEGVSGKEGTLIIEVIDMTGKVVFSEVKALKGENVNLIIQPDGQLPSGAYLLRVFSESFMTTQSLIIR